MQELAEDYSFISKNVTSSVQYLKYLVNYLGLKISLAKVLRLLSSSFLSNKITIGHKHFLQTSYNSQAF
jgi:hypothetical protein